MPTALVTGASRGLGLEWCKQLTEKGWTVLAACRAGAEAPQLASLAVTPVTLDVADGKSVAGLSTVLDGVALDLLVNNAGVRHEECGPNVKVEDIDFDSYSSVLATNMLGPCRVLAAALPALARADQGAFKVVNVSSKLGSIGFVDKTRALHPMHPNAWAYRRSHAVVPHPSYRRDVVH